MAAGGLLSWAATLPLARAAAFAVGLIV